MLNGLPGDSLGRIDIHNELGGGRVILRASLGEEQQSNDRFGAAIARADLDGDDCPDLVVGAPGVAGGGAVYVIYGAPAGMGTGASIRIPLPANPGDAFGEAVAVESIGSTTSRHFGRIWIGAPGRDVSGHADAGVVAYTDVVDRVASTPRLYTQNSSGVPGQAETGDRFGEQLAAIHSDQLGGGGAVLVGQPSEDIGARKDAGMVTVLPAPGASPAGRGPYGVTQDTPGIPGAVEVGDRFGAAVDALADSRAFGVAGWVGVPGEDLGGVRDAGMVHGLRIGATKAISITYLHQGQANGVTIPGRPEAGDHFGASVLGGQFESPDGLECREPQVLIGVPGEDLGTLKDAGEVDSYFGGGRSVECRPGTKFDLGPNAHTGDRLGAAVATSIMFSGYEGDVPLIGIPGYDIATAADAGVVLKVTVSGTSEPPSVYTASDRAVPGAQYGAVLERGHQSLFS